MSRIIKSTFWSFVFIVFAAESLIFYYSREPFKDQKFDYILLLGIAGRQTNELMIDRTKLAIDAAKVWPDAKIIITGNESLEEVSSLKALVLAGGVNPNRIIEETQSKDTWDNIVLSKKLMSPEAKVLIITNEFHQMRALAIARVVGVNAYVYGRDPRSYSISLFLTLRERGANIKWLMLFVTHQFSKILS